MEIYELYGKNDLIPTMTVTDASDGIRKSTQQKPTSKHSITLKNIMEKLLPTPSTSDQYNPNTKNDHDKKKGYLRDMESVISSREASPASHSLKPDEEKERQMTVSSGRRCLELYESLNLHGSSLKTCVAYLVLKGDWYSNKCALTWKTKVTMSNRLLFQLAPSVRRTEEIECGLLPTSQGRDWKGAEGRGKDLPAKIEMIPTPQASDATTGAIIGENDRFYMTKGLPRKVNKNGTDESVGLARLMLLKTPSASEAEGGWKVADKYWEAKAPKLKTRDQVGRGTGLKLQPNFVEWMMGFPQGWTDLAQANTELKD